MLAIYDLIHMNKILKKSFRIYDLTDKNSFDDINAGAVQWLKKLKTMMQIYFDWFFQPFFSVISLLTPGFTWFYQTSSTRVKPHFNPLWLKNGRFLELFRDKKKVSKKAVFEVKTG